VEFQSALDDDHDDAETEEIEARNIDKKDTKQSRNKREKQNMNANREHATRIKEERKRQESGEGYELRSAFDVQYTAIDCFHFVPQTFP
jgi:uncharacterized protein YbaP (TraB family)